MDHQSVAIEEALEKIFATTQESPEQIRLKTGEELTQDLWDLGLYFDHALTITHALAEIHAEAMLERFPEEYKNKNPVHISDASFHDTDYNGSPCEINVPDYPFGLYADHLERLDNDYYQTDLKTLCRETLEDHIDFLIVNPHTQTDKFIIENDIDEPIL